MTTEANDNDPRVSDAYREMATESTPAELDREVLAMAAAEARTPRGLPRTWFRPLAWAATIALSFALVLEITQVDNVQLEPVASPRTDADLAEAIEESPRPAAAAEKQKNEARLRQQLNKLSSDAPAAAKATITPAQPETAARDAAANSPVPESLSVAPDNEQYDLGSIVEEIIVEAEEEARMRPEPAGAVASFVERKGQPDGCDEGARSSAEAWYECVTLLRDTGQTEVAQKELEALLVEFPDFGEPPGDQ